MTLFIKGYVKKDFKTKHVQSKNWLSVLMLKEKLAE